MTKIKNLASGILSIFDYFGTEKYVFQAILDEFTGPHSNKYIPGYASGTYVYATENEALEACVARVDCGGVTQETATRYTLRNGVELVDFGGETSWLKKSFTGPHSNKYIPGYASGTYIYATKNEALLACRARVDCGGVTQESTTRYTLRNGVELIDAAGGTSWLKKVFTGPHSNKYIPGYPSGTYEYATLIAAQVACKARVDCGGVTQESSTRFTLRNGVELIDAAGGTSWLKVGLLGSTSSLCGQLLQQFHRVDEELSIQGKWQGGSVTGVCRGWGTSKVSSILHCSLGR
jgi:hypothetical protein